jgi:hypothetical protein
MTGRAAYPPEAFRAIVDESAGLRAPVRGPAAIYAVALLGLLASGTSSGSASEGTVAAYLDADTPINSLEYPDMKYQQRALSTVAVAATTLSLHASANAQTTTFEWKVVDGGNGHWYQIVQRPYGTYDWNQTRSLCMALGGDLASFESSAEWQFMRARCRELPPGGTNSGQLLAGGRRAAGGASQWTWLTGPTFSYFAWNAGAPNDGTGQSLVLCVGAGIVSASTFDGWDDWRVIDLSSGYVIEWSADCNNDGIVDYGQIRSGQLIDADADNVPDCCEQSLPCVPGNGAVQWRQDSSGNGHWYQKQGPFSTWFQARDAAIAVGAHLMTITSEAEWGFAFANIPSQPWGGTVLGGYQLPDSPEPGVWVWVTGEQPWPSFIDVNLFDDCPGGFSGACGSSCPTPHQQDHLLFTWPGGTNPNQGFDDAGADFSECGSTPSRWAIFEWDADCNSNGIIDYGEIRAGFTQDVNGNNIPDCCEPGNSCCPGDINASRTVDGADVGILLGYWGDVLPTTPPAVDINHDGVVNGADLGMLLSHWGACP